MVTELLVYAFSGGNVIPTALMLLMLIYWLTTVIGLFDFDMFDVDLDLDLDAGDTAGPLEALAVFINVGKVPVALVFSLVILNFWILAMLTYYLPFKHGGLINGLILIPAFVLSVYLTKIQIKPLKKIFKKPQDTGDMEEKVLSQRCYMVTDLGRDRMGQAKVRKRGADILINVRAEFEEDTFKKGEVGFVFRKDPKENVYYIAKPVMKEEIIIKEMED